MWLIKRSRSKIYGITNAEGNWDDSTTKTLVLSVTALPGRR
jgi:hypothetical protein